MNCREFTIEFEERGSLSETATLHLTICADCKKLSDRQTRIWRMIDELKPVDAPNDFDFRVKARIAQGKPSDFKAPRFLPVLRYVLPLSVVVVLLSLFAYNSAYFFDATQLVQQTIETPNVGAILPSNTSLTNQLAFAPPENQDKIIVTPPAADEKSLIPLDRKRMNGSPKPIEIAASTSNRIVRTPKTRVDKNSGGSNDFSVGTSRIRYPKGINPSRPTTVNTPGIEMPKPLNDEQLLLFFGIEIVVEKGKRIVKNLQENNVGTRSGVKIGDVIETVRQNLITVTRGTEKVEISLQK
jgi:hypothetical protein